MRFNGGRQIAQILKIFEDLGYFGGRRQLRQSIKIPEADRLRDRQHSAPRL
jgi:hypothetical protein